MTLLLIDVKNWKPSSDSSSRLVTASHLQSNSFSELHPRLGTKYFAFAWNVFAYMTVRVYSWLFVGAIGTVLGAGLTGGVRAMCLSVGLELLACSSRRRVAGRGTVIGQHQHLISAPMSATTASRVATTEAIVRCLTWPAKKTAWGLVATTPLGERLAWGVKVALCAQDDHAQQRCYQGARRPQMGSAHTATCLSDQSLPGDTVEKPAVHSTHLITAC